MLSREKAREEMTCIVQFIQSLEISKTIHVSFGDIYMYGTPKYIWQPRNLNQNGAHFWAWGGGEGGVELHRGLQQKP